MLTKKKNILIVDDESTNIFALSAVLIPRGYSCKSAWNGEQCMKILNERPELDIILMDIMMPFMDGIETIKLIRDMPEYRSTKIIVTTADDTPAIKLRSQASGADGYLNKPIDIDLLEALF